jgi:hypothetical protein
VIPVIFVYRVPDETEPRRRHAILPALPMVGDLVIPPREPSRPPRNVRAREWDVSQGNGSSPTIHIVLDD